MIPTASLSLLSTSSPPTPLGSFQVSESSFEQSQLRLRATFPRFGPDPAPINSNSALNKWQLLLLRTKMRGGWGQLFEVHEEQYCLREHGGTGQGHLGPFSSAEYHNASLEHPCHPQRGALRAAKACCGTHNDKLSRPPTPARCLLLHPQAMPKSPRCQALQEDRVAWAPYLSTGKQSPNLGGPRVPDLSHRGLKDSLHPPTGLSSAVPSLSTNKEPGFVTKMPALYLLPLQGPPGTPSTRTLWRPDPGGTPYRIPGHFPEHQLTLHGKVQDPVLGTQEQSSRHGSHT